MSSLAALFALSCGSDYEPTPEEIEAQRKYMEEQKEREKHTIFNLYQFQALARVEAEGGALGVKVLRDKTGVLHWMDTKVWPFHYPFCVSNLGEKRTLQEFNEQVYTGKDRSMMFATVVSYPSTTPNQRHYCLELNPADPMNELDALNGFFEEAKRNFCHESGAVLHFHPTSTIQTEAINGKKLNLPIITSEKIYHGIKYKLVQAGEIAKRNVCIFNQRGYTEADLNKWLMQRTAVDLVVIPSVPNDIPVVGGVICCEIIPPLCHVALLCQNRKTPCCYVAEGKQLLEKALLGNVQVSGAITRSGFFLDGENYVVERKGDKHKVELPASNNSVTQLIDLHEDKQHATDIHVVGAKAAQLAHVEAIYSQPIFKGAFVIPFHHYNSHVFKTKEVTYAIQKKLIHVKGKPLDFNDFVSLQDMIKNQPVDDELVKSVIEKINQNKMTSVIFRSSTNAEDLTGFNGAGLYESVPVHGNALNDSKQVSAAIKKVWASVWSPKAVKEREHYLMDHKNVNMAILVQPYLDKQATGVKVHYNGVCITHDVARHKVKHGFLVNCFPGTNLRATNHYKNETPEQTMLVLGREANSVDVQVTTNATGQTHSMVTQHDAEKMVQIFGNLHSTILKKPHKLDDTVALDIEFMVVDNEHTKDKRELVVLQARPYTVNVEEIDGLEVKFTEWINRYKYGYYDRRVYFSATDL
jgi:hypothetical protein